MGFVIDLTREEGARILEEDFLLYDEVKKLKKLINSLKNREDKDKENIEVKEFFASNVFVSGSRGTGKTSVLITLRKELSEDNSFKILPSIDLSVNYTGIVFYILSHFKEEIEKSFKPTDCCSSSKLEELFDKLVNNFPKFLKCFCNNDCSFLCNEELEILLDQHEISFLKNFFEFIDQILGDKTLILILDDIDLIPEPKILLRTILELAVFLNHPKIIIIGAGDIENLKLRLLNALESINFFTSKFQTEGMESKVKTLDEVEIKKLYETVVLSLLDKIFPITNRINLSKITPHLLEKIEVYVDENAKKNLKNFLKDHPTFFYLDDDYYFNSIVKHLFSDISLREFVQILRTIKKQINEIKENSKIKVKDIMVSEVLLNLHFEDFVINLKTNFDTEIQISKAQYKITYPKRDNKEVKRKLKELEEANFEAFVSFLHFLNEIIRRVNADYLNGKKSVFSLIYSYSPKLASIIQVWAWEINLYLKGHIYFYPLVYLIFLLIQGLHRELIDKDNKENVPSLNDLLNNLLSSTTSKEDFYIHLSIILVDTVKSVPNLIKEYRNTLGLKIDVKPVRNYYPILKFFKGFILITKLGIDENLKDIWIVDYFNYKTLGELDIEPEEKSLNVVETIESNLKNILFVEEATSIINSSPVLLKLLDLDNLSLAYFRGIETRIKKKGSRDEYNNAIYLLPFYSFIGFYIDKQFPDWLFTIISKISRDFNMFYKLAKCFFKLSTCEKKEGYKDFLEKNPQIIEFLQEYLDFKPQEGNITIKNIINHLKSKIKDFNDEDKEEWVKTFLKESWKLENILEIKKEKEISKKDIFRFSTFLLLPFILETEKLVNDLLKEIPKETFTRTEALDIKDDNLEFSLIEIQKMIFKLAFKLE